MPKKATASPSPEAEQESKELAVRASAGELGFSGTPEQMELLKRTYASEDFTDDEFQLFAYTASRTGLDPMARQVYAFKSPGYTKRDGTVVPGKVTIGTTIDGLRLVAERTGKYLGQTEPEWVTDESITTHTNPQKLVYCKVGVYKKGYQEPTYGIAYWDEFAQVIKKRDGGSFLSGNWERMPRHMLAKVAEALALRKAFPQELSGIYTNDEIATSDNDTPEGGETGGKQPPAGEVIDHPGSSGTPPSAGTPSTTAAPPGREEASGTAAPAQGVVAEAQPKKTFTKDEAAFLPIHESQQRQIEIAIKGLGVDDEGLDRVVRFVMTKPYKDLTMLDAQEFLKLHLPKLDPEQIVQMSKDSKADEIELSLDEEVERAVGPEKPAEGEVVDVDPDKQPDEQGFYHRAD